MKLKSHCFACEMATLLCFCTSILYFLWFLNAKHVAIITLNFPTNGYQKQYLLLKNLKGFLNIKFIKNKTLC